MILKILQFINTILNGILALSIVSAAFGIGYWFTNQIQADAIAGISLPEVLFSSKNNLKRLPQLASGVFDIGETISVDPSQSDSLFKPTHFKDTSCANFEISEKSLQTTNQKYTDSPLFETTKDELQLKAILGKTAIYGQDYLNDSLLAYSNCVMEATNETAASVLGLTNLKQPVNTLQIPTRVILYDNLEDYSAQFKKAYDKKLGDTIPWGLSENETISTFIRLQKTNKSITEQELKDIKYRLTYNISHEYFHRLFNLNYHSYIPFIEEGLAVYISGKVTTKILGYKLGCSYTLSQANLLKNQKYDLDKIKLVAKEESWYSSNDLSQQYALGYYFIKYLDDENQLKSFVSKINTDGTFLKENDQAAELPQEFKLTLNNYIKADLLECNRIL